VLVVSDGGVVAEGLAAALERAGSDVTVVRAGDAMARQPRGATVRPGSRDDFRALADALRADDAMPELVVHAGGVEGWSADALAGLLGTVPPSATARRGWWW
jgi:CheY-like chemotaxis protein